MTELITAPDISTVGGVANDSILAITTATGDVLYQVTAAELAAFFSGGAGALTKIDTIIAAGGEASLGITGIPDTYEDLIISARFHGSTAAACILRLNNDASAIYDRYRMYNGIDGGGGDQVISGTSFANVIGSPDTTDTASYSSGEFQLIDYANSATWKNMIGLADLSGAGANNGDVIASAGRYRSNTAISRIDFIPTAGTFGAGSRITVYGRG